LNKKQEKLLEHLSYEDFVNHDDKDLTIIPTYQWDAVGVGHYINDLANYAISPNSDGFMACESKRELYLLKCLIEDLLGQCPSFPKEEKEWEQERFIDLLKRQNP